MKPGSLAEILVAVYVVAALFAALGTHGLSEPDEGRYASVGREMAEGGDWLLPHLNGIPHLQKPPLLYWATALGFRAFGADEASARLPSALAALSTLALTYGIARRLYDLRTALVSVLLLVTSLEFFALARMLTPDMMLTLWCTAAVYALVRHAIEGSRSWAWAFFVFVGLGFLTKGPMAFVVPIAAAVTWRVATRSSGARPVLPWRWGLPLALGIGLSWHLVMVIREPALATYFAGYEFVDRVATTKHGRAQPIWFYAPVLLGGFLPWTPALVAMCVERARAFKRGWRPRSQTWLLLGWVLPPLLILSVSGSKLLTYVLPLLPPIGIAMARWLRGRGRVRAVFLSAAVLMGLIAFVARTAARWDVSLDVGRFAPAFAVAAVGLVVAGVVQGKGGSLRSVAVASIATVFGWQWCLTQADTLNDMLGVQPCVRPLARRVLDAPDVDEATLFVVDGRLHGFEFYTRRYVMATRPESDVVLPPTDEQAERLLPEPAACDTFLAAHAPAYGLVRAGDFDRYFSADRWAVLDTAGVFVLVGTTDTALAQAM